MDLRSPAVVICRQPGIDEEGLDAARLETEEASKESRWVRGTHGRYNTEVGYLEPAERLLVKGADEKVRVACARDVREMCERWDSNAHCCQQAAQ